MICTYLPYVNQSINKFLKKIQDFKLLINPCLVGSKYIKTNKIHKEKYINFIP
jgi:hypothetical protein